MEGYRIELVCLAGPVGFAVRNIFMPHNEDFKGERFPLPRGSWASGPRRTRNPMLCLKKEGVPMPDAYLLIGEITKPQGVRGELKARPITCDPERFYDLEEVYLEENGKYEKIQQMTEGEASPLRL